MLDYQRIVEEIQAALAAASAIDWDLLRDCAAEYAAACDEVNQRLGECGQLLRRGLRSEAIQLAERQPNLLDAAAQLDFPELEQWQQLLAANGMVLPPALRLDIAADLNSAYAVEAPLQSLLKTHRLLALARAPLANRIHVLRLIRSADLENPVWAEDLRALELHRVQQIERDVETAQAARDAPALTGLMQELMDAAWLVRPRADLLERVRFAHQRVVAQHARHEMTTVLEQLRKAYEDYDVAAARLARDQWDTLCQLALMDGRDPLLQEAQVALDWLAQQEQAEERKRHHAAALHALERGLDNDIKRNQLERLMLAAQRSEEEIPQALLMRYGERMRLYDVSARRRFTLRIAAVVGVLFILGGATAWIIQRTHHERQVAGAAKSFTELVNQERLAEAQDFLAQLQQSNPAIAARTEIQEPAARLALLVAEEEKRASRFKRLMDEIESKGPTDFSRSSLLEATELAQTLDEKARVADWESQVAEHERSRRRQREEVFRGEIAQLVDTLDELEGRSYSTEWDEKASAANAKVKQLNGELALVSAELGGQLQPVAARLNTLMRRMTTKRKEDAQLQELQAVIGNADQFRLGLTKFAQTFPESPLADQFKQVAAEADLWTGTDAWAQFYKDTLPADLADITPEKAKRVLEAGKPLLEKYGNLPHAEPWKSKTLHLEAVASRLDDNRRSRSSDLRRLFEDPLLKSIHRVTTSSGECYYLKNPIKAEDLNRGTKVTLKYLVGFDFSEKSVDLPKENITKHGPAPQQTLAEAVQLELDNIDKGKWDAGFFNIILLLLNNESDLDPVLRLVLLKRTVEVAQQGSHSLNEACSELRQRLEDRKTLLAANWLDPSDANVRSARESCRQLLVELSDVEQLRSKAKEVFRADTRPVPVQPQRVGWLLREADHMQLITEETSFTGSLYVLYRDGAGLVQWTRIGQADRGQINWVAANSSPLLAGRPVYLHAEDGAQPASITTTRR